MEIRQMTKFHRGLALFRRDCRGPGSLLSVGEIWALRVLRPIPDGNGLQTRNIDQRVADWLPTYLIPGQS
jgi:hypothetical protein